MWKSDVSELIILTISTLPKPLNLLLYKAISIFYKVMYQKYPAAVDTAKLSKNWGLRGDGRFAICSVFGEAPICSRFIRG